MKTDRQYMNLLVFSVIAGIVSIVIMVIMLALGGTNSTIRKLTPVIVTIETGLLLIVANAIYTSVKHIQALRNASDQHMNTRLQVSTCPDYWTLTSNDSKGNKVCTNTFKDPTNPKVTYTISGSPRSKRQVRLSDYNELTVREVCEKVKKEVKSPWHAIDAMC